VIAEKEGGAAKVQCFAPQPTSVSEARRFAGLVAAPYFEHEQLAAFELVVSEVMSNAVRYGGQTAAEIKLAILPKDGYMCVQVTDDGPGLVPSPGAVARFGGEGGFGLFIVERLSRRWGMTREDERTRVWFELEFVAAAAPVETLRPCA
jgi:anti-sigma regulatory factor (Ser/Thr protein kinase)